MTDKTPFSKPTVLTPRITNICDHEPIITTIKSKTRSKIIRRNIPKIQRHDPRLISRAEMLYANEVPGLIAQVCSAQSGYKFETIYREVRRRILVPFHSTKRSTPCHYKPCCNKTLEHLSKLRTKLYLKALTTNQEVDKGACKTMDMLMKEVG